MSVKKATDRRWFTARANGRFGRFRKDQSGVTAIEFGMIALPFFALVFGIIEMALVFFATELMDSAVTEAGRLIRTGQAQSQGINEAAFKAQVCSQVVILPNCSSDLKIDVRTFADFEAANSGIANPVDASGSLIANLGYQPGVGGDIVIVRAFYEWQTIMPNIGLGAGNMANGNRLLASTVAFRNEPF